MSIKISVNDLFSELKEENNRLLDELLYAKKCVKLLENYRNFIKNFLNRCECNLKIDNKIKLIELENEFELIFNNNKRTQINNQLIVDKNNDKNSDKNSTEVTENTLKSTLSLMNIKKDFYINTKKVNNNSKVIELRLNERNDNKMLIIDNRSNANNNKRSLDSMSGKYKILKIFSSVLRFCEMNEKVFKTFFF